MVTCIHSKIVKTDRNPRRETLPGTIFERDTQKPVSFLNTFYANGVHRFNTGIIFENASSDHLNNFMYK